MKKIMAAMIAVAAVAGCGSLQRVFPSNNAGGSTVTSAPLPPPPAPYGSSGSTTGYSASATATAPPTSPSTYAAPAAPTLQGPLADAERRLAIAAQERGLAVGLAELADPDTIILTVMGTLRGPDEIRKGLAPPAAYGPIFMQPSGNGVMSGYGDLGSTTGSYLQWIKGQEAGFGRYLLVWRKDALNRWRIHSGVIIRETAQAAARKK
ncbi:MAG: hypothetical protein AB7M12_05455 [Hyphomonadaceae bacterium]